MQLVLALGRAVCASGVDHVTERPEVEDDDQRDETNGEAGHRDRDLLTDRVGGDGRGRDAARKDLDKECLLNACAAGSERDSRRHGVDAEYEQHVLDRATDVERLEQELRNTMTMVTLSEHGVYAHDQAGEHHLPALPRKIVDVSGAGDTVIAVAALALAHGLPLDRIAALSNLAGGLVCEEVGVVPIDVDRLRREAATLLP